MGPKGFIACAALVVVFSCGGGGGHGSGNPPSKVYSPSGTWVVEDFKVKDTNLKEPVIEKGDFLVFSKDRVTILFDEIYTREDIEKKLGFKVGTYTNQVAGNNVLTELGWNIENNKASVDYFKARCAITLTGNGKGVGVFGLESRATKNSELEYAKYEITLKRIYRNDPPVNYKGEWTIVNVKLVRSSLKKPEEPPVKGEKLVFDNSRWLSYEGVDMSKGGIEKFYKTKINGYTNYMRHWNGYFFLYWKHKNLPRLHDYFETEIVMIPLSPGRIKALWYEEWREDLNSLDHDFQYFEVDLGKRPAGGADSGREGIFADGNPGIQVGPLNAGKAWKGKVLPIKRNRK